ncbi:hypothetical protein ES703_89066 [subsurface metagenome]
MATLIKVITKGGVVRRCDARCYNARHPKCVCICGGVNHGVGLKNAVENIRQKKVNVWEVIKRCDVRSYKAYPSGE